jgi:predicted metal-dependent peptidase
MNNFDSDEFFSLARELEKHHAIFDRLWSMGKPVFTQEIPTAAVYFDKVGETIDFKLNPDFWAKQTSIQKQFVIAHECLHVILYHGFRINGLKGDEFKIANLALDIVVNHSLVDKFGFIRSEIDPDNIYCWVDTVFKKDPPESGKYYEFYYNLLEKLPKKDIKDLQKFCGPTGETLDSHEGLESFNTPEFEDKVKEMVSEEELENLSEFIDKQTKDIEDKAQQAGCSPGNTFVKLNIGKVKKKKKWETVIKKWASKFMKDKEIEQWARPNRRLAFMPQDFMIPSDQEVEEYEKDKITVYFFQDTSGSCSGFVDRFFKAAKSLPTDRFDIKMHCFDTRVFETTLESGKLYGFGGTSFSCIENYIQNHIKKHNLKYPAAVFVITDGYGNHVSPQKPKNWYWFIQGSFHYVPKESNRFNLKDFE